MADPTLQRLLAHMGWANQRMFATLGELPAEALQLSAWNPDWQVGTVANHIVVAAGRLVSRINDEPPAAGGPGPTTGEELAALARLAEANDRALLALADATDEVRRFDRAGQPMEFQVSTILAQAVHHATEHRAQIVDILAANGLEVINLDSMDLWSFELWQRGH